jgi:hypothetical protein
MRPYVIDQNALSKPPPPLALAVERSSIKVGRLRNGPCRSQVTLNIGFFPQAADSAILSPKGDLMFDSLSDQMKHDLEEQTPKTQRIIEYLLVAVVSVVIFGGLYMGIRFLQ